jgi:hypothetical protein
MQTLSRLRAERYSSSSGHRLSGPLLQSYHGSPRHSWKQQQKKTNSFTAVVARLVVLLLVVVGCYVGGKHYMYRRSQSQNKDDFLASLGLGSGQSSFHPPSLWPPSDLGLKMPSWPQAPADPETAAKALKGTRAGRYGVCTFEGHYLQLCRVVKETSMCLRGLVLAHTHT